MCVALQTVAFSLLGDAGSQVAVASSVADSARIAAACSRIHPRDLLRIQADSGFFEAHVSRASFEGLAGLHPWRARGANVDLQLLTWDRIQSVAVHENQAGHRATRGAIKGAAIGGGGGLLVLIFATNLVRSGNNANPSWIYVPALVGAGAGGFLGAVSGAAHWEWRPIYP